MIVRKKNPTASTKALSNDQKAYIRSQYQYLTEGQRLGFAKWVIRIMKEGDK